MDSYECVVESPNRSAISFRALCPPIRLVARDWHCRSDNRREPYRCRLLPIGVLLRGDASRRRAVVSGGVCSQPLAYASAGLLAQAVLTLASGVKAPRIPGRRRLSTRVATGSNRE